MMKNEFLSDDIWIAFQNFPSMSTLLLSCSTILITCVSLLSLTEDKERRKKGERRGTELNLFSHLFPFIPVQPSGSFLKCWQMLVASSWRRKDEEEEMERKRKRRGRKSERQQKRFDWMERTDHDEEEEEKEKRNSNQTFLPLFPLFFFFFLFHSLIPSSRLFFLFILSPSLSSLPSSIFMSRECEFQANKISPSLLLTSLSTSSLHDISFLLFHPSQEVERKHKTIFFPLSSSFNFLLLPLSTFFFSLLPFLLFPLVRDAFYSVRISSTNPRITSPKILPRWNPPFPLLSFLSPFFILLFSLSLSSLLWLSSSPSTQLEVRTFHYSW